MSDAEVVAVQLADQSWKNLEEFYPDLCRIINELGTGRDDLIIKMVLLYVTAELHLRAAARKES